MQINTIGMLATVVVAGMWVSGCSRQLTYSGDVEIVLKKSCGECHAGSLSGLNLSGFSLDSYESLMEGDKQGPVIIPGSSASSTFYQMVSETTENSGHAHHSKLLLSIEQVELVGKWIDQGAVK